MMSGSALAINPNAAVGVQAYQKCYADCRARGGTVQSCQQDCDTFQAGSGACVQCPPDCGVYGTPCPPGCSRDCGFGSFLIADVTQTVTDAAGKVWQVGGQVAGAVGAGIQTIGVAALGIAALIVVLVVVTRGRG